MPSLDELLGKASLKERISELEEARSRLEGQLEGERQRRSEAVRDRQEAQEQCNHLEDRIAGLEGELSRLRTNEHEGATWSQVKTLSHTQVTELVDRLEGFRTGPEGALSAVLEDGVPDVVRDQFEATAPRIGELIPCIAYADDLGLLRVVVRPPRMPEPSIAWKDRFSIDRDWFAPVDSGVFALARADLFAVGTYADGTLSYVNGFESPVMGRHSKGGFSQARFERRRSEQVDEHLDQCRESLDTFTEDPIILVGDRRIVSRLAEYADSTATIDASGSPRAALDDAFRDFWTTRLYLP